MSTDKGSKSVLKTLTSAEQAAVLADLLTAHPELVEQVERLATARVEAVDRNDVAAEVAWALRSLTVEEVWERGRRETDFMHENEAAWLAAEEAVQPYLDDMRRAAALGMDPTARETCWGILLGLYECRDIDDDDCGLGRASAPDFTGEHAAYVLGELRSSDLDLAHDELAAAMPRWAPFLRRAVT